MIIYYHPRFQRSYRRLDPPIKALVTKQIAIFRSNPFDTRLDAHHLHGRLKKQWSFSVNRRYRILFEFLGRNRNEVVFLDVGPHGIYR